MLYSPAVEHIDNGGYLPLHMVSQNGNLDIFKALLKIAPGTLLRKANNGRTALHFAAQQGHIAIVRFILNISCDAAAIVCHENRLPLHLASFRGCMSCIIALTKAYPAGVRVMTSSSGHYPLHIACEYKHTAAVAFLYELWPDANLTTDFEGRTPLLLSLSQSDTHTARLLLGHDNNALLIVVTTTHKSCLHLACFARDCDFVREVVDRTPQLLRVADSDGYLPIHISAQTGCFQIFEFLASCDPETISVLAANSRRSPLSFAAQQGHSEIVQYILNHDRSSLAFQPSIDGAFLPLHLAAFYGCEDTVELLLHATDDVKAAYKTPSFLSESSFNSINASHSSINRSATINSVPAMNVSRRILTPTHNSTCAMKTTTGWLPLHSLLFGVNFRCVRLIKAIVRRFPAATLESTIAGLIPGEILLRRLGFCMDRSSSSSSSSSSRSDEIEISVEREASALYLPPKSTLHLASVATLSTLSEVELVAIRTLFTVSLHCFCESSESTVDRQPLYQGHKSVVGDILWLFRRPAIYATYFGLVSIARISSNNIETFATSRSVCMDSMLLQTAAECHDASLTYPQCGTKYNACIKTNQMYLFSVLYVVNTDIWKYVILFI